ncbi:MAG: hypothetical protein H6R04_1605 [Burkholderiaceae bacterium]|nr:hypothetical protein [Burkholderiaceae bacterium]
MKIAESNVVMSSASAASSRRQMSETLRAWVGDTRPDFEGNQAAANAQATSTPASAKVSLSDAGKTAQSGEAQATSSASDAINDAVDSDPRMRLLKLMIEFLTGEKITVINPAAIGNPNNAAVAVPAANQQTATQPPARAGYGVEYDYHASYSETASMSFETSGVIRTADGKEIQFSLSLSMQRSYSEQTDVSLRAGDGRKKVDPLVINFDGNAAQLTDQTFSFDLNADGTKENISFVRGGGFLALDKNGDGKINDGSELFGPASGNGFAELGALDGDGNGWIDENDAAFSQLQIWTKGGDGVDVLTSLKDANVGALFLGNVSSPFDLKDANNQLQGQVRSSGVWLSENGVAGSIQQVDLVA